jgi:hydrogenase/urease accessory protein HupE
MRSRTILLLAALLVVGGARSAPAHEARPGYLELRETDPETFAVLWKVPARGNRRLGIHARLPDSCEALASPIRYQAGGAFTERRTVACPGGLTGKPIVIDGLAATLTDVLVRLTRIDGTTQVARLTPAAPSFVVEAAPTPVHVAATYLRLGVEHILGGIDHLLFVLALLLVVNGWRRLLGTITAFTVAHSLTLAAATLGLVHVPQRPVEAIIALSIVFVAGEIAHGRQGRPGLTARWPWVVAFTFGLLHGFGFAGALQEVGLPEQAIPVALFFFNVGVELGQLLFVAAVVALGSAARRFPLPWPAWAWRVPAYGIGALAAYWTIERVVGFWS